MSGPGGRRPCGAARADRAPPEGRPAEPTAGGRSPTSVVVGGLQGWGRGAENYKGPPRNFVRGLLKCIVQTVSDPRDGWKFFRVPSSLFLFFFCEHPKVTFFLILICDPWQLDNCESQVTKL